MLLWLVHQGATMFIYYGYDNMPYSDAPMPTIISTVRSYSV